MTLQKAQLLEMLRTMILIREFDERAIQLRVGRQDLRRRAPVRRARRRSRSACARPSTVTDRVTSTHRGHGHCIAKGADIQRMMAELFGRVDGYCKGKGGSMHIADFAVGMLGANGIVGGGLPIACGAALAAQLEGKGDVDGVLLRRRRGGRGRVPRGAQHRLAVEAADRLRLREQPVRGEQRGRRAAPARRRRGPRRRLRHARRHRRRQRRAGGPRADARRRSPARAAATGRPCSSARRTAGTSTRCARRCPRRRGRTTRSPRGRRAIRSRDSRRASRRTGSPLRRSTRSAPACSAISNS